LLRYVDSNHGHVD